METMTVRTNDHSEMLAITAKVQEFVRESGVQEGAVDLFVPHTTAGITINESADRTVVQDILTEMDRLIPWQQPHYTHREGNSAAHIKASLMGSTIRVFIKGGRLVLGTWQGIFFCEFDGPRTRKVLVGVRED